MLKKIQLIALIGLVIDLLLTTITHFGVGGWEWEANPIIKNLGFLGYPILAVQSLLFIGAMSVRFGKGLVFANIGLRSFAILSHPACWIHTYTTGSAIPDPTNLPIWLTIYSVATMLGCIAMSFYLMYRLYLDD